MPYKFFSLPASSLTSTPKSFTNSFKFLKIYLVHVAISFSKQKNDNRMMHLINYEINTFVHKIIRVKYTILPTPEEKKT
jgi:hypothetical protein